MAVLHKICFISLFFLLGACASIPNDAILENALSSADKRIKKVMDNIGQYEIQIRYTQIDRANDSIIFTDHDFQVNPQNYFYPASTVKFPTAVATLEKLNGMDSIDRNFKFYIEGDSVETTFAHNITEIFAISGNEANNRLIEFLGQDDLNERMKRRGVGPIRISHRLSTINADEVSTKPLVIYYNDTMVTTTKTIINSPPKPLSLKNIKKGDGYYVEDSLYMKSFDFSLKNYFPIEAQSRLLKRIIFPKAFPIEEQFDLTSAQHQFLLDAMQALPKS
ncbi:MAG: serine hydrolase, partial [Croceitalea sp.]|nr:serine hydrolase [Croceitalea sp.]